ncbi:hypothetical protein AMTR_s00026p00072130 [Amborella trichopoda]|uniref:Uncharacterized protein n=1 Tax=Amborella trichopoda TaxID=13333 RepID=W1PQL8_AMBTC|nr:hypothetical protein AMTR_s00026p00072130 [Amborella trichopoda]
MLKIVGMKAVFRESEEARKLLIDASFFTSGSPLPVGGPTDNVYMDAFGEVFDGVTMETKEVMYLLSVRSCILMYRGGPPSEVEVVPTTLAGSLVGSPACSFLSLGDFLATFAEGENLETTNEVSSVEVATLEVPTLTFSKVELRPESC